MRSRYARVVLVGLATIFIQKSTALGQSATMPAGWQSLDAEQFVDAADSALSASTPLAGAELQAVVEHAWTTFLNDSEFVASGQFATLQTMLDLFGRRSGDRLSDAVSRSTIDAELTTLQGRLATRLEAESGRINGGSFDELRSLSGTLSGTGYDGVSRARLFADWMDANDWQQLSISEVGEMYEALKLSDQVVPMAMGARWTGTVTPTASGEHTFSLLRQNIQDPNYKLWIDGNLVLDVSERQDASVQRLTSRPVRLSAGTPVSIRLEMSNSWHESAESWYSDGNPAAALFWQQGEGTPSLVPSTALSPPADYGEGAGQDGLKGEYFQDAELTNLVATRLDESLEFVWTFGPIAPVYQRNCDEILDHSTGYFNRYNFGGGWTPEVRADVVGTMGRLPLSKRQALLSRLRQHPALFAEMDAYPFCKVYQTIYTVPGDDKLEILRNWAESRPQPQPQPGRLWGGSYSRNWEYYWHIGIYMQGPYFRDAEALWADGLERANGECNLSIAYATAFAAQASGKESEMLTVIQGRLGDETLTGDARMTWLVALTFAEEVLPTEHEPKIGRGMENLEEAFLVAESDEYRFWALKEQAVRLAALGRVDQLSQLLENVGSGFQSPEQQNEIAAWQTAATENAAAYAEADAAAEVAAQEAYVAELQRRLAAAQANNNQAEADRYQRLLGNMNP